MGRIMYNQPCPRATEVGISIYIYIEREIEGLRAESLPRKLHKSATHPFTPLPQIIIHFLERLRGTLRVAHLDELYTDLVFRPFGTLQILCVLDDHTPRVVCRFSVGQDDVDDRLGRVDRCAEEPAGLFEPSPVFVEQLL